MNIVIISIIVAVLVLAAGIWFAWPFMARANRRLEKAWQEKCGDDFEGQQVELKIERQIRHRHLLHTAIDLVVAAIVAGIIGVAFHLSVSKTIIVVAASVAVFHLIVVPYLALLITMAMGRSNAQGWWRAPLFVLIGNNPVKWYTWLTRDWGCRFLVRTNCFHPFILLACAIKWRNSQKEDEEWGAGT